MALAWQLRQKVFHQQRRPDGVDGKGLRHLHRVKLLPAFFGLVPVAMQQAGGVDQQPQWQAQPGHMGRRPGDAGLMQQVERGLALA